MTRQSDVVGFFTLCAFYWHGQPQPRGRYHTATDDNLYAVLFDHT